MCAFQTGNGGCILVQEFWAETPNSAYPLHEKRDRRYSWDKSVEDKIKSMTLDQVNTALKKHIDPNRVSIVKAGDFKAAKVFQ